MAHGPFINQRVVPNDVLSVKHGCLGTVAEINEVHFRIKWDHHPYEKNYYSYGCWTEGEILPADLTSQLGNYAAQAWEYDYRELKHEYDQLLSEYRDLETQFTNLRDECEDAHASYNRIVDDLQAANVRIRQLNAECRLLASAGNEAEQRVKALQTENTELKNQLRTNDPISRHDALTAVTQALELIENL